MLFFNIENEIFNKVVNENGRLRIIIISSFHGNLKNTENTKICRKGAEMVIVDLFIKRVVGMKWY